ncbi:MAG: hypothetical protein QG597_273 [Actinomycetota bacterium]|nr:hypothetical protein [Actinomycetota bacterium]
MAGCAVFGRATAGSEFLPPDNPVSMLTPPCLTSRVGQRKRHYSAGLVKSCEQRAQRFRACGQGFATPRNPDR